MVGALYVACVAYASLSLLKPAKPPVLPKAAVVHSALTKHLLFVVVDGLRYDIATDPGRMPRFAEAMRTHRSSQSLAGAVSMTSSAILTFGSGQRGRLEQIARNINPDPPPFESWMQNARERGLTVALVGDPTWAEMFGHGFSELRQDPPGVAIDYDFNDKTFRDAREILGHAPNAMVLHFVTPDHQGHAYGVQSARYKKHITNFDRLLFDFLSEVGPGWSVVVTSDHGANDAGDHGGDILVQRRSPIFAYGPGIAPPPGESEPLDQVDVAGTLAALLGVPAPCHSQGHLLVDWLALPNAERARISGNDVERALTFARVLDLDAAADLTRQLHTAQTQLAAEPARFVLEARRIARQTDHLVRSQQGVFSPRAWWTLGAVSLGAALVAWLLLKPIPLSTAASSVIIALISIALTATVERLPGNWPKASAGVLFGALNLPTLLLLLRPEGFLSLLRRCGPYAPALVPGALAVSYPRNLQPEGCAVTLIVPLVILGACSLDRWGVGGLGDTRRGRSLDLALLLLWWVSLFPASW
ncbi:MAG TPA: alkaline phosphatase family protein, partial [Polyangiaceae bacterium]